MASFDAYARFQVRGHNLQNLITGLGSFWVLTNRYMLQEGLGTADAEGLIQFDPRGWYPLVNHLRVLARVKRDFGEVAVRQTAAQIPCLVPFPPTVVDVRSALDALDLAYHMNHGSEGQPLYSPETGVLREGIGHYRVRHIPGQTQSLCESTTPYPCCFDEALLLGLARRFEPSAALSHSLPERCRDRGGSSCIYSLLW